MAAALVLPVAGCSVTLPEQSAPLQSRPSFAVPLATFAAVPLRPTVAVVSVPPPPPPSPGVGVEVQVTRSALMFTTEPICP